MMRLIPYILMELRLCRMMKNRCQQQIVDELPIGHISALAHYQYLKIVGEMRAYQKTLVCIRRTRN